ncbi:MAG: tRNA uridine-5-carboxymethylaminomethyl(34) synthesis GTPase MnmE [Candidatus Coproplasma sp.]
MNNYTIAAIATAPGTGGVAIIRVSGPSALSVAERVFVPTAKHAVKNFTPSFMYTGKIVCDGFSDFGLCVYFKAPKSFTGEDVIELHCHGGKQIAHGVLNAVLNAGAVLAGRGEFTKRAFVNGKLSLSSAEGMIDMINAESLAQIRAGSMMYTEKLTSNVEKIQSVLTDVLAQIAADTDYPEEGIEETELSSLKEDLTEILNQINAMAGTYSAGRLIKNGVLVTICGSPNVGKSSLLNSLLGYDKAIVSEIPGTTRDVVEGAIIIDGVKFNLTDTAGIREGADMLEDMGIDRAKRSLKTSDLVVCVSDSGDFSAADGVEEERLIKVFSKTDIGSPFGNFDVAISSLSGDGLNELKQLMAKKAIKGQTLEGAYLIEERHFNAFKRAGERLKSAIDAIGSFPLDLISMDIRAAWQILGEVTGKTADEDVIDVVFSKFCVGK